MKTFIQLILLLLLIQRLKAKVKSACTFPESELRPFFYEVKSDIPVGTNVLDTEVQPPDAKLVLASVRSNAFPSLNFTSRFSLQANPSTGHFSLSPASPLSLPSFPSSLTETYLYITIVCNDQAYPLITVRVTAANTVEPQFYGEPYTVETGEWFKVGSTVDVPITAIDWDPAQSYNVTFSLEDASHFKLIPTKEKKVPEIEGADTWPNEQLPNVIKIKKIKEIELPTNVTIIASDNGFPPRTRSTTVKIIGSPMKPASHFKAHASKIQKSPALQLPTEYQSEFPATFMHCHISVNLMENSPNGTLVTILKMKNRKPDTVISLVDPDGTFELNQDGEVHIANNRLIDRELFSTLEVVAEIKNSNRMAQCGRIRLRVVLQDENDNRPVFEKQKYFYHLSQAAPVGTEFGVIKARDIDEVENGHVSYTLLTEDVPFKLTPRGHDIVLTTTEKLNDKLEYNLVIEARDHGEPVRTSEVPVDIFVLVSNLGKKEKMSKKSNRAKVPIRGVASVQHEPLSIENRINVEAAEQETIHELRETVPTTPKTTAKHFTFTTKRATPDFSTTAFPTLSNRVTDKKETTITADMDETFSLHKNQEKKDFHFTSDHYYYEVFGSTREDDIVGRVVAEPNPQMYGIDRKVAGLFKVDQDIGEISVAHRLYREKAGNITFTVSGTNGISTAQTVVTVYYVPENERKDATPRFDQSVYKFSVPENTRPEVIGIVRAFHLSATSRSDSSILLKYDIISEKGDLPFSVHQLSGEVANEIELDHEFKANYNFKIRACLSDEPTNCGIATVLVTIEDQNDNSPHFPASLQHLTLPSDLAVGAEVLRVHATDFDDSNNGEVSYVITPPSSTFAVNYGTGSIVTVSPLTEPRYSILIEAFDHGIPRRTDVMEIRIDVQGTNPSAPVFDKSLYEVVLTTPVRAGSVVAEVRASDPDPGDAGKVRYSFPATDDPVLQRQFAKFQINERTGVISAIEPLNSVDGPFDLVVEAEDQSLIFHRKATTTIHVELFGDTSLRFLPLPVNVFISSEKALGSVVLRASTMSRSRAPVDYSILEDNPQFIMDGDLLRVANHLVPGETRLTIRASTDSAHVDHQFNVIVMADREKYPVYPQLTYDIDIPADARFPLTVHRFAATLSKGMIHYEFFPPNEVPKGLIIDEVSGELLVTSDYVKEASNHDTKFIVVRAKNIQFPDYYSDVGVALNLVTRRSSIRFPQSIYRFEVMENTEIGSIVGTPIEIFPRYPSVEYVIVPDTLFGIHPNGSIFLKGPLDLESVSVDNSGSLNFVVSAVTSSGRASAKLQLRVGDENEFVPEVEPNMTGTVKENSLPGTEILRVNAIDRDFTEGSHLLYKIVGGSGRDLVFIQEDGTIILGEQEIDREKLDKFDVEVEIFDKGGNKARTHIEVQIEDENDNPPKVQKQPLIWNVTEGALSASFPVVAMDADSGKNGLVKFRIIQGNGDGYFRMVEDGPNRASIHLLRPLDFEDDPFHVLTLEARDGGTPSQFAIVSLRVNVINVNDNSPRFKKTTYKQKVPSDLPTRFPVITVSATDADNDLLKYNIKGVGCGQFEIDPQGVVSFSRNESERREGVFTCTVESSDGQHTTSIPVELEVYATTQPTVPSTNRAPVFSQKSYNFAVSPDLKPSEPFGRISTSDPDGDQVLYSIRPAQYRNLFDVDAEGSLRLKVPIEELSQPQYSFVVKAEDWGPPIMSSVANVHVHVTNISPMQSTTGHTSKPATATSEASSTRTQPSSTRSQTSSTWSKPSSTQTDSSSTQFQTDGTTRLVENTRTTSSSLSTRTFHENEITRKDNNPLVTEQIGPIPTTVPIIKFTRTSYMYSLHGDSPPGTYLGQVLLTYSKDVNLKTEHSDLFEIDESGRIHTSRPITEHGIFEDEIIATYRNEKVATVPFVVHIIPTTTVGSALTTTDASTSAGTTTRHSSSASLSTRTKAPTTTTKQTSPPTRNTERTPSLQTTQSTQSTHTSRKPTTSVHTTETEGSAESTVALGTRTSQKPQDNKFSFNREMYFAFVPEGNYGNGIELTVKPEKLATNLGQDVKFSISDRSQSLPFFITETGELIVFDMDREERSNYMIEIHAKSASRPSEIAVAHINVTVLDVNDNYPNFEYHPDTLGIVRDLPVGTTVYKFEASDSDADLSGQVEFEISPSDYFQINTNDGTLTVAKSLEKAPSVLSLTVTAKDLGRPALKTHHKISIQLFDRHSPAPLLPTITKTLVVPEGSKPHTKITTILAGPNVLNNQEKIHYELVDSYSGLFEIHPDGVIVLGRVPMDHETGHIHQLNVTATNSLGTDSTLVNILLEGVPFTTVSPLVPTTRSSSVCSFEKKVYNVAIDENTEERTLLAEFKSSCSNAKYSLEHDYGEFEIIANQLWAVRPLDRERKSLYFLYVNAAPSNRIRVVRQNPVLENAKSKLRAGQSLVFVRVLDENDNAPSFVHLTNGKIISNVDWQADIGTPITRIQAKDLDERADLIYGLEGDSSDMFSINASTGLITLAKKLDGSGDKFELKATVSDGLHIADAPVLIYKLSPSLNVVRLTSELAESQLNEYDVERTLNQLLGSDSRVLGKQSFIDEKGNPDPYRSHIFVYSVDKKTKQPQDRNLLVQLLSKNPDQLMSSPARISDVSLMNPESTVLSGADVLILILALLIVLLILIVCCFVATYCRKKRYAASVEHEYMVDSVGAGPRPYDVEKVSRQTAQNVLASRALPDPLQNQVDLAVSPAFMNSTVSSDRSTSTKEFANSVRERPSLLQSALARHKVHAGEGLSASVDYVDPKDC